jgi:hypothetical protein
MRRQSTLLLSGLAALNTLITALPAIAFTAFNNGETIPTATIDPNTFDITPGSAIFNLDIDNTTGSPVTVSNVTLNIASLVAGADALDFRLGNIQLYLSSPNNTFRLTLKDDGSNVGLAAYGNGVNGVTFTDLAIEPIDTVATDPVTGSFQPQGTPGTSLTSNISSFAGFQSVILAPGLNTWQLTTFNFDDTNTAPISDITLNVTPVPIESDALPIVLSAGFMGVGIWAKRRFKNRQG